MLCMEPKQGWKEATGDPSALFLKALSLRWPPDLYVDLWEMKPDSSAPNHVPGRTSLCHIPQLGSTAGVRHTELIIMSEVQTVRCTVPTAPSLSKWKQLVYPCLDKPQESHLVQHPQASVHCPWGGPTAQRQSLEAAVHLGQSSLPC